MKEPVFVIVRVRINKETCSDADNYEIQLKVPSIVGTDNGYGDTVSLKA